MSFEMRTDIGLYSEHYILSSGRKISANRLILGISPDLKVYEGYDGELEHQQGFEDPPFTAEERREIADHAIELWSLWADGKESDR